MTLRRILIVLSLFVFQAAYGQLETLVNAVETAPSNIHIPASENGAVVFKPCFEECNADYMRVTLGPVTQYLIDGRNRRERELLAPMQYGHVLLGDELEHCGLKMV